ncbi:hypothetical protein BSY19_5205 (plasmid) [Bosea sp. RAC05]|nr:hypothetical protein BSY19_5205 [Bosea sp. RAC05]
MSQPTYAGIQNAVRNSPTPPTISSSNPHWVNVAIAGAKPK